MQGLATSGQDVGHLDKIQLGADDKKIRTWKGNNNNNIMRLRISPEILLLRRTLESWDGNVVSRSYSG
jgi:hypothetical protein